MKTLGFLHIIKWLVVIISILLFKLTGRIESFSLLVPSGIFEVMCIAYCISCNNELP